MVELRAMNDKVEIAIWYFHHIDNAWNCIDEVRKKNTSLITHFAMYENKQLLQTVVY